MDFNFDISFILRCLQIKKSESESQIPPKHNAQNRFSNGKNGSWIPSKTDDNLK